MDFSALIAKINGLLTSTSGFQLEFQPSESLDSNEWSTIEIEALVALSESMSGPAFIMSKARAAYGFPVQVNGSFAGLAIIEDQATARDEEESQALNEKVLRLAELFTSLIETKLRFAFEREAVSRAEEKIEILQEETKVVELRSTRLERVRNSLAALGADVESLHSDSQALPPSVPLLIDSESIEVVRRIASDAHERANRWAMLRLQDLSPGILGNIVELKQMGGITLLIEDLSTLTAKEQEQLAGYLSISPSPEMPQVVAALSPKAASTVSKSLLAMFQRLSGDLGRFERAPELLAPEQREVVSARPNQAAAMVLNFHLH